MGNNCFAGPKDGHQVRKFYNQQKKDIFVQVWEHTSETGMGRDGQSQVNPEPVGPRIDSYLFYSL
jgi:hypothetical protein